MAKEEGVEQKGRKTSIEVQNEVSLLAAGVEILFAKGRIANRKRPGFHNPRHAPCSPRGQGFWPCLRHSFHHPSPLRYTRDATHSRARCIQIRCTTSPCCSPSRRRVSLPLPKQMTRCFPVLPPSGGCWEKSTGRPRTALR